MAQMDDMIGKKFGKLTVINCKENNNTTGRNSPWECVCDCGNEKIVSWRYLICARVPSHYWAFLCLRARDVPQITVRQLIELFQS